VASSWILFFSYQDDARSNTYKKTTKLYYVYHCIALINNKYNKVLLCLIHHCILIYFGALLFAKDVDSSGTITIFVCSKLRKPVKNVTMINVREYNLITDLYNTKLDWNFVVTFESYY